MSDVSIGFGPISGVQGAAQELLLHFGYQPEDHPDVVADLEQGLGEAALALAHEVLARHGLSVTGPPVSSQDTAPAPRQARVWNEGDPDPAEEGLVIRDADGDVAAYRNGHWDWTVIDGAQVERRPWSWPAGDMAYPATEVLPPATQTGGTP